ncbi:MAG: hypothetical protein WBW84_04565 [Acidobacteriaceae bacterium]
MQQAIGDDHTDELLEAAETAKQRAKDAAQEAVRQKEAAEATAARRSTNVELKRRIAGTATGAALGGYPAYEVLRHLPAP